MACRPDDPPIDIGQSFPLDSKILIDGIRLTQNTINHVVAIVDSTPFVQHILCFGRLGIIATRSISVDIGPYIRQQVGTRPSFGDERADPSEFATVISEDLTVA